MENTPKETIMEKNPYGFENMKNELKANKDVSTTEMEDAFKKIKDLSEFEGINEVIAIVNGKEITRFSFEAQKITKEVQYNLTTKEIMYSLIRPIVIQTEAERLKLKPSQDGIDEYISSLEYSLDNEYVQTYMKAKELSYEEYMKEQKENAYKMFLTDALCKYAETLPEYDDAESYINHLIKYADIKIYDSEIEKECLKLK